MNVKKIGIGTAVVGAMAFTVLGVGSGVASADPTVPASPGVTLKLDRPHWDDWDDWDDRRGPRWEGAYWDGPGYGYAPQYGACAWVPPAVSMWVPPAVC